MNDIHYQATNLNEINCDGCDKFLCNGFIDYADDCGFLCSNCKKIKTLEEIPEITKQKQERLQREFLEKQCGESTEGHQWEDITHKCLCFGSKVFSCSKCAAQKTEPMNMSFAEMHMIPVPKLKFNLSVL